MDDREQAAAYAAADWTESHGKIPGYFRERFSDFAGGRVIDLGCGTADVTIRFVKAFPEVTVVGVDGSDAMLAFARKSVHNAGRAPVLIVDLVRPPDHQTAVQLVQEHARGAPPVLERDFIASLHAAYSVDEVREQLVLAGLPEFNVDQVDVLHWVAWSRAPI